jgi:hypothetical protein
MLAFLYMILDLTLVLIRQLLQFLIIYFVAVQLAYFNNCTAQLAPHLYW